MEAQPPIRSDSLVLFETEKICSIAKFLRVKCQEKFQSIEEPLKLLETLNLSRKDLLIESLLFSANLLELNDIEQLGFEKAKIICALSGKSLLLRLFQH